MLAHCLLEFVCSATDLGNICIALNEGPYTVSLFIQLLITLHSYMQQHKLLALSILMHQNTIPLQLSSMLQRKLDKALPAWGALIKLFIYLTLDSTLTPCASSAKSCSTFQ